jgi:ribose transport system permease protein
MTLVITLGGIDLSVGSLVAFLGGIGILLMNRLLAGGTGERLSVAAAFGLMLIAGALTGALNGALIAKGKLAPFIATLGGLAAYRSLAMALVAGGEYRSGSAGLFGALGAGGIPIPGTNMAPRAPVPIPLLLPWPVVIFAIAAIAAWIVIHRTRLGRYIVAIGSNERAAVYSGIPVDRVKILTYTMLGLATGMTALLSASRLESVSSSTSGSLYELDAIAAVVIGGTRMRGGSGVIAGTVIGALILGVIQNMLNLLQVSVYLQGLVKGLIIVAAALLQRAEADSNGK